MLNFYEHNIFMKTAISTGSVRLFVERLKVRQRFVNDHIHKVKKLISKIFHVYLQSYISRNQCMQKKMIVLKIFKGFFSCEPI